MNNALIGYTGFVGSTIMNQMKFEESYRSTNISDIDNKTFDTVVCAGAPGYKWIANQRPKEDADNINSLISHLKTISCNMFILISTVDVYKSPIDVNEQTIIDVNDLHPYGLHRYELEKFVEKQFKNHLIVRLPGLVGDGLKKNVLFDLKNNHEIDKIDERNIFQYYPMKYIMDDIDAARSSGIKLINFCTAPVLTKDIADRYFNIKLNNNHSTPIVQYGVKSMYGYTHDRETMLKSIQDYAQSV